MADYSKLRALSYYGGKSSRSSTGTGAWVASLLPEAERYVEPFAGMLGVLLQRPPSRNEVANDLNGWIVNWWRVVRDRHDELVHWLDHTPESRAVYEEARSACQQPVDLFDPVAAAGMTAVALVQGRMHTLHPDNGSWLMRRSDEFRTDYSSVSERLPALAERMRRVTLECRDAIDVIELYGGWDGALLYCDPPYAQGGELYSHTFDVDRMLDVCREAKAKVAISGYPNCPWTELGWHEHRHETFTTATHADSQYESRTEMLWTNYDITVHGQQVLW